MSVCMVVAIAEKPICNITDGIGFYKLTSCLCELPSMLFGIVGVLRMNMEFYKGIISYELPSIFRIVGLS